MSQSFAFPANPTLNQIVTLPEGEQAQWNGYAWVSLENNVTYPLAISNGGTGATNPLTAKRNLAIPIWTLDDTMPAAPVFGDRWVRPGTMTEVVWMPNANPAGSGVWVDLADAGSTAYPVPISKGGTGATTAAQALINLGITNAAGQRLMPDGMVTAPGLAWASEPGLGWYRPSASTIATVGGGGVISYITTSGAGTTMALGPTGGATVAGLNIYNGSVFSPNYNALGLNSVSSGYTIGELLGGTATAKPLNLAFPAGVQHPDGTVAAPGIAFASEPGLGLFRSGAGNIAYVTGGVQIGGINASSTTATFSYLFPRTTGSSNLQLWDSPPTAANVHILSIGASTTGYVIQEQLGGTATAQSLTMNFPAGVAVNTNGSLAVNSATNAQFSLNAAAGTTPLINGLKAGKSRWQILFGDGSAESGGNVGSNFYIQAENDAGAYLSNAVQIVRSSSSVSFAGPCYAPSFNPSSDERLKEDIHPLDDVHDSFMGIAPIRFKLREGDPRVRWGFSAQQLQRVAPHTAVETDIGLLKGDSEACYLGLDIPAILAMLVLEVQRLNRGVA